MESTTDQDRTITELERRLQQLTALRDRDHRALAVLYRVSIACRGMTSQRAIFDVLTRELRDIFTLDACYIGLCDMRQPGRFRWALLYDEGLIDYVENAEFGPITGRMVRERKPIFIADLDDVREAIDRRPLAFGNPLKLSRAWMGIPLMLGEDAIGVVSIQSYEPGIYTADDHELLQQLGPVIAVALDNANLSQHQLELSRMLAERVAARTAELTTLGALAAEMVLQHPLPTLLDRALALILPLFDVRAAIVRRYDPATGVLHLLAHRGLASDITVQPTLLVASSTIGAVIANNEPIVVPERLAEISPSNVHRSFQSLLGVPLRIGEHSRGTLALLDTKAHSYDAHQLDLAQVIGNQIAIAIDNAQLFAEHERQIHELKALGHIGRGASTAQDLQTLLPMVHTALSDFLQIDSFLMFVYDRHRGVILEGIGIDDDDTHVTFHNEPPPQRSFTGWIIKHKAPLRFGDVPREIERYPELTVIERGVQRPSRSWLGVPLLDRDGEVIGTLAVQSYSPYSFTERDERFLVDVAQQVALHVQNVKLLVQRQRQIDELDAIGQIGQIASGTFELDDMLRQTYEVLLRLTGASSFYLIVCDSETYRIRHAFYIDGGEEIEQGWRDHRAPPGSLTDWILHNRRPLLFGDIVNQAAELSELGIMPHVYGSDARPCSWAGVPLLAQDAKPIGVIAVQDTRPYQYDQQTIEFLNQVASHLSLGVQKVYLFAAEQAARRTADTLREVARVLSTTFDQGEVFDLILNELRKVIAYDSASIMLLDGQMLRMVARKSSNTGPAPRITAFALEARSAAGLAVHERRPVVIDDTRNAPEWSNGESSMHVRSWLGLPLIARGSVIGVLNIDSNRPHHFSERDSEVALAFARQAAVAMDNARLYRDSVTRIEQELEIAHNIQSNLFPRTLPRVAGYRLAARCLPAKETGGDFYDLLLNSDGRLALMVGDASGKSIPGAMLMAIARSIARSEARDHSEPETVMRETNRLVSLDVPPRAFVALSFASLDPQRRQLALANAGQLSPMLRSADGGLTYLDVAGPTLPLGISPETLYAAREITLVPGDTLLFYTDGIVEARDASRALFGFERLEALVREYGDHKPAELIDRVLAAIDTFCGSVPQHDDMTLLVLQVE